MMCSISGAASRQFNGYADGSEFGQSTDHFEKFGAVLLDEHDPVAGPDA